MPVDPYKNAVDAPPSRAWAVTPNDSADLIRQSRGIWVGVAGDLRLLFAHDEAAVTLTAVPVGLYPMRLIRVYATGTTAGSLVAVS